MFPVTGLFGLAVRAQRFNKEFYDAATRIDGRVLVPPHDCPVPVLVDALLVESVVNVGGLDHQYVGIVVRESGAPVGVGESGVP
jgi:hypothetical protein